MDRQDFQKIPVGEYQVGVIGLNAALAALAGTHAEKSDEEVGNALTDLLSKKNYISASSRQAYAKAFVREFRKYLGQPCPDEPPRTALRVEVVGPGCYQCDSLEQSVIRLLNELQIPASFEHISDLQEIARYGIMRVPALLINGKVVCMGTVPSAQKIKEWLNDMVKASE
jgi:small redox-active disulfide protein 2